MNTENKKQKTSTTDKAGVSFNPLLSDVYCPCCGLSTEQLHEGYCKPCLEEKKYQLDTHNNNYDRWGKLTYEQRNSEVERAINFR